jgi:3-hydroxyisobutyrate dehydrogenase-like beta-hydroxyacid dehydrogenase
VRRTPAGCASWPGQIPQLLEGAGRSMIDGDFAVSFHLRTMVKDTELIRNHSETIGVPVMMSNMVHELNKVAQNMGWGELNATAIFKLFEVMAGIKNDNSMGAAAR